MQKNKDSLKACFKNVNIISSQCHNKQKHQRNDNSKLQCFHANKSGVILCQVKLKPMFKQHLNLMIWKWIFVHLTKALNSFAYWYLCKTICYFGDQAYPIIFPTTQKFGCCFLLCLLSRPLTENNFLLLNQNLCCGYSKEPSQWDGSFEHPKHMLKIMGKKIFTYLPWNFWLSKPVFLRLWKFDCLRWCFTSQSTIFQSI